MPIIRGRNVHPEFGRNIGWQTFDFDFAGHHFEDAALQLDALRFAERVHGNLHAHAHVHGDAQQVHVKERALDRIDLIFLHDGGMLAVLGLHRENRVVSRGRAQDRRHVLCIYLERLRSSLAAIKDSGNCAGDAETPGCVFAPGFPGRCFDYDLFHKSFPISNANFVYKFPEQFLTLAVRKLKERAGFGSTDFSLWGFVGETEPGAPAKI